MIRDICDLEMSKFIGEGYFCTVRECYSKSMQCILALKQLKSEHKSNQEFCNRFTREIRILRDLQECNEVIELLGFSDEEFWYLMPLADMNLYEYVKSNNSSISNDTRYLIIEQIITALTCAHEKNILHRDLSPRNVMIFNYESNTPIVKVSDFGLGKDNESYSAQTHTSAGGFGHDNYTAPEQLESLKYATNQSDIYSLGKLTYFILTGRDPVTIRPNDFRSLIIRAIQDVPSDRHENINAYNAHFLRLKEIVTNTSIDHDKMTISEIISSMKDNPNFEILHNSFINPRYDETNSFHGYISPIYEFLLTNYNLRNYCNYIKNDIIKFVIEYAYQFDKKESRWPFDESINVAKVYILIIELITNEEVRKICLIELWKIGFEADQWNVQKAMATVFNKQYISQSIEIEIAEYIQGCGRKIINIDKFKKFDIPLRILKAAIINDDNVKKIEESGRM